jgi:hypothetical protein
MDQTMLGGMEPSLNTPANTNGYSYSSTGDHHHHYHHDGSFELVTTSTTGKTGIATRKTSTSETTLDGSDDDDDDSENVVRYNYEDDEDYLYNDDEEDDRQLVQKRQQKKQRNRYSDNEVEDGDNNSGDDYHLQSNFLSTILSKQLYQYLYPPNVPKSIQLYRWENLAIPACYLLVGVLQGLSGPFTNVYPLDLNASEAQQVSIANSITCDDSRRCVLICDSVAATYNVSEMLVHFVDLDTLQ